MHVLGVRPSQDRADHRGDHLDVALRHSSDQVAHEMDPPSLPGRTDHHRVDRCHQPEVDTEMTRWEPPGPRAFWKSRRTGARPPRPAPHALFGRFTVVQ
jgi:hypothetical protein